MFEGAELDCNIAEPLAQVAADMTDSSSTVQVGITFITPRPSRSVERRGLKECRRLCTLSRQGPVGILETVSETKKLPVEQRAGRAGLVNQSKVHKSCHRSASSVKGARVLPCRALAEGASMTGPESLPTEFAWPCRVLRRAY